MRIIHKTFYPREAKDILATKNNLNVRKIRLATVSLYARQMASGLWHNSWDCIAFDKDGNLLNGQHRLLACVKSNIPINVFVIYDAENITGDTGLKRSVIEELKGRGENVSNAYESTFGVAVIRDVASVFFGMRNATADEVFDISYLDSMNRSEKIVKTVQGSPAGISRAAVASAIIAGYVETHDDRCIDFAECIRTGVSETSPLVVVAVRDFLIKTKRGSNGYKYSNKEIREYVQCGLRSYLAGNKTVKKQNYLTYKPTEDQFREDWK